ncbi:M24 family metallopeptidase [Bradyrhizobium sp. CCBAU 51753]|uniref:M24 family metallopeptidase n=1 Tax=Bradyrhizobium sp. CCBAU 51753 TaxID=1325100 RepID=UPI00352FF9B5
MRSGRSAAEEPFFFCRERAKQLGLDFRTPWIDHSFSIEPHEFPLIRPGEKTKLEVGMVFNIEAGVTPARCIILRICSW